MNTRELITPPYVGAEAWGQQVAEWRSQYNSLLVSLDAVASEVKRRRTLEKDPDVFPRNFVRDAVHEFVFPPQEVDMTEDADSGVLEGNQPYTLTVDNQTAEYDKSKVQGHLRLIYDDTEQPSTFRVEDVMGESVLPEEVVVILDKTFPVEVAQPQISKS